MGDEFLEYQILEGDKSHATEAYFNYNPDKFLKGIYWYYENKGFRNILVMHILQLILAEFLICFIFCLIFCVELSSFALYGSEKVTMSFRGPSQNVVIAWVFLASFTGLMIFVYSTLSLKKAWVLGKYCQRNLGISTSELEMMPWNVFLYAVVLDQPRIDLSSRQISDFVMILTRQDNYLIALLSNRVMDISVPFFPQWRFITKVFEWSFYFSFRHMFNLRGYLDEEFMRSDVHRERLVQRLRHHFIQTGIFALVFSPAIFFILIFYGIFTFGDRIKNFSYFFSTREWTPYSVWKFRDYNEVDCIARQRMAKAFEKANKYVSQFRSPMLILISNYLIFMLGTITFCLILLTVVFGDLVYFQVGDKSVLWMLGIFGTVIAILRENIPSPDFVFEPNETMKELVAITHHFPKSWIDEAHTPKVRSEFLRYFKPKLQIFFMELISVIFTPLIFIFSLPNSADGIVTFIRANTRQIENVGPVIKFSIMEMEDTKADGGDLYEDGISRAMGLGEEDIAGIQLDETNNKVEISILNFQANYPNWNPKNEATKSFIKSVNKSRMDLEASGGFDKSKSLEIVEKLTLSFLEM